MNIFKNRKKEIKYLNVQITALNNALVAANIDNKRLRLRLELALKLVDAINGNMAQRLQLEQRDDFNLTLWMSTDKYLAEVPVEMLDEYERLSKTRNDEVFLHGVEENNVEVSEA